MKIFTIALFCLVSFVSESKNITCNSFHGDNDADFKVSAIASGDTFRSDNLKLGFNIELAQTKGANGNYSSEGLSQLVKQLQPNSLRYPGGTPANYFNWHNEKLDERQVKLQANKHINKLLDKLKRKNKGKVPVVSLKSYVSLIKQYDIKPFIVLNMFVTNDDLKYAVDKVKKEISKPVYWELGNEVSNESYQKKVKLKNGESWSAEVYAQKIKYIGQYIKSKYPEDRIGVVVSEMAKIRNPDHVSTWRTEMKRESWDEELFKYSEYFDAVIIHPYVFANNNVVTKVECGNSFTTPHELKYKSWLMSNVSNLSTIYIERLDKRFPNKKIWITEFGIIDKNNPSQKASLEKQTGFRALSTTLNFVSWLKKYPKVSTILVHGMFVGYNWAHIVYPDSSYTANGLAYHFIKQFLSDIDEVENVKLDKPLHVPAIDSFQGLSISPIQLLSGRNSKTGQKSMLLVNVSNHSISITLPWKGESVVSKSFKWNEIIKPGDYVGVGDFDISNVNSSRINIQPRSIVLVKGY